MIDRISANKPIQPVQPVGKVTAGRGGLRAAGGFGDLFQRELERSESKPAGVAFSKHAIARAEERGIEVTPILMDRLAGSVERAQAKGATNIVAIDATQAFIINVPNGRVITTMSQEEMKEAIFTNIDGAVFL